MTPCTTPPETRGTKEEPNPLSLISLVSYRPRLRGRPDVARPRRRGRYEPSDLPRPRLRERPAAPVDVLGSVRAVSGLMDAAVDLRPGRLGAGEMRVEVVDVHPRLVRGRLGGGRAVELEHHERAVAPPELDPRGAVLVVGKRVRTIGQRVRRLESERGREPPGGRRRLFVVDADREPGQLAP